MTMTYQLRMFQCLLVLSWMVAVVVATCGTTGRDCIAGRAHCSVDGKCVCNAPNFVWGRGDFMCYRADEVAAEVYNDPYLTNFNNETTEFPYPCRYMMTHVGLQLHNRFDEVIGFCEIEVYGFNRKNKGKIYPYGFDAAIRMTLSDQTVLGAFSIRNYGTTDDGPHVEGIDGKYLNHGPWASGVKINYQNPVTGISVRNYLDPTTKQMVLEAKNCGVRVTFATYNEALGKLSPVMPGISVAISTSHNPIWLSHDITMGLPPVSSPGGQLFADLVLPWLDIEQSAVHRAFATKLPQVQPDAPGECTSAVEKVSKCDDDSKRCAAYNACYWMLKEPRFIRCIDKRDAWTVCHLLTLFSDCMQSFCASDSPVSCEDVADIIGIMGCDKLPRMPKLDNFINHTLCTHDIP